MLQIHSPPTKIELPMQGNVMKVNFWGSSSEVQRFGGVVVVVGPSTEYEGAWVVREGRLS